MDSEYKIIKLFSKRDDRYIALIEYKDKQAVLKKLLSKKKKDLDKFQNESKFLSSLSKKPYVPTLYEFGDNYIIMEYFESHNHYFNKEEEHLDVRIIERLISQLFDIKTTKFDDKKTTRVHLLYNVYKTVLKIWLQGYIRISHFKLIYLMTIIFVRNRSLFFRDVSTKGDFTDVNILINDKEIKFIDFEQFNSKGYWLEDACALTLHQDEYIVDNLVWRKQFLKYYILRLKQNRISFNNDYLRFWLLYTAMKFFLIRIKQYKLGLNSSSRDQCIIKAKHILYFMNKNSYAKFLTELE